MLACRVRITQVTIVEELDLKKREKNERKSCSRLGLPQLVDGIPAVEKKRRSRRPVRRWWVGET